jgi:hypothetical protein
MAKYDPLRDQLRTRSVSRPVLTFDEIAALLPGGLPPSSYEYQAWWSNDGHASHVHARAWLDAGWTAKADLQARTVTFTKTS